MLIRVEIPIDAPGIDALLRRSFESDAEAKLVHDLREDGFLTLGLVATDDEGQVVGYVAFSPVDVQGEDLQWVGTILSIITLPKLTSSVSPLLIVQAGGFISLP
ncbi:Acetyltransferase [Salmonella enterica subsp. enterica serovar Senftenberg str. A4-543]|uniref:Acetyltransferase n=1 Tax=Salmonella enterica subsp. enterica serovar Senftenberg str. A4-543 TaxID=913082 RepID=G5R634_SALSE|nr:Acetyltransferase [Salmonella enterica subsp. enterica serovar Senftenberg str. A4-543]